eukprot:3111458-Ditylum_brightwellii.AAC.1
MSIISEDETSECQCKAVLKMIGTIGQQLEQWKELLGIMYLIELTLEYEYYYVHDIPDDSLMNIGKLGDGAAITTDT